jgi:glycosyltransferase involved in cell wall biosynthesis
VKHSDTPARSRSIEISVVVPVRDEEDSIRILLEGLLKQTQPPAEIVLTDTGSIDDTREIIEEFIDRGDPVKLVRAQSGLPGRGRNLAVANSRCDWIAFTDAGNRQDPNWLAALSEKLGDESTVDVVYGTYEPVVDSFFKECAAIAYVPPAFESEGGLVRPRSIVSALMRRQVWETVGGFPEDLRSAEDLLFMRRVEQAKFNIVRTADAVVYWNIQPNLWRTYRRFVEYSRHNIRAGLFAEWQGTIFIYYALLGMSSVKALSFGWRSFLIVPPILWLLLLTTRALKSLYRNRKGYRASLVRNFARLWLLVPIIAVLDAAAFVGSLNWLIGDYLRGQGSRGQNDSRE